MWYPNDMFHYMFEAEFVTLACSAAQVPSGSCVPDGTFKLASVANLRKKYCDINVVFVNDTSFHYMLKAEFATLVSLKVPSGSC